MRGVILLILSLFIVSCSEKVPTLRAVTGEGFGTTYNIQYYTVSEFDSKLGIDSVLNVINRSVSTYMPDSDISKINNGDSTIVVDEIFREVYQLSETVYNASEGYFDPTIGVLRNAYGFGDVKPIAVLSDEVLDSLRQYVGFEKVSLTSEGIVQKEYPEIYFDFNAVAKGYGIDRIGDYLEQEGVENYLIELGGEILSKGKNLNKDSDWSVGVESVSSEIGDRSYAAVITISDKGMAASGNYRKFRIDSLSGKKYVHTINPLTGLAEQSDVTSATVIAADCATADAYATAFMAMGLERSKELLQKNTPLEAYLTFVDSTDTPQVFITEGFKNRIRD
ncbi:FAD:protein FMN transferase [Aureitalea sp. L0-47]|uniref:FAD:protein FMN transferase n=1 Tax=Aureitalea sp. L0-47 TaxID=2816962 RepID=UPI002238BBE4|nr:FAD:protein FMN transferase [Aureitalea sp. L0-47]MCW5521148.1 FAD:protein FMN transferase [Aureitalea sp. L0-47]